MGSAASVLRELCKEKGVSVVLSDVFAQGSAGGIELAKKVIEICENETSNFKPLYELNLPIEDKINTVAREIYGADGVELTKGAKKNIKDLTELGYDKLPICVAKTQYSFSDEPTLLGAPTDYNITVREVKASAGAGFLVVLTGDIMTMPGLPKVPAANGMDIFEDGTIIGLS